MSITPKRSEHLGLALVLAASAALGCGDVAPTDTLNELSQALDVCGETVPENRHVDGIPAYAQCDTTEDASIWSNNGIDTSTTSLGDDWIQTQRGGGYQCTELAYRYMRFRWNVSYRSGNAQEWCDGDLPDNLVKTTTPVHGDLIVFAGGVCGASASTGHIAVVDEVDNAEASVTIVEENRAGRRDTDQSCATCFLHAVDNDGSSGGAGGAGGLGAGGTGMSGTSGSSGDTSGGAAGAGVGGFGGSGTAGETNAGRGGAVSGGSGGDVSSAGTGGSSGGAGTAPGGAGAGGNAAAAGTSVTAGANSGGTAGAAGAVATGGSTQVAGAGGAATAGVAAVAGAVSNPPATPGADEEEAGFGCAVSTRGSTSSPRAIFALLFGVLLVARRRRRVSLLTADYCRAARKASLWRSRPSHLHPRARCRRD
jgi:MYXO-CTERM domain-containing protein